MQLKPGPLRDHLLQSIVDLAEQIRVALLHREPVRNVRNETLHDGEFRAGIVGDVLLRDALIQVRAA